MFSSTRPASQVTRSTHHRVTLEHERPLTTGESDLAGHAVIDGFELGTGQGVPSENVSTRQRTAPDIDGATDDVGAVLEGRRSSNQFDAGRQQRLDDHGMVR